MTSERGPRRFVVESAGPRQLSDVLAALGAPRDALRDGRVRVAGKRASDARVVLDAGTVVELYPPRRVGAEPEILGEAGGFVAVDKPPELATEPDRSGTSASLRARVARLLRVRESTLHAVGRLDVGVSGVVLFARTASAKQRTAKLNEERAIKRRYIAIAARAPEPDQGVWQTPIEGRPAETRYAVTAIAGGPALLTLDPATGRRHQLRIHAAGAGAPLLGDRAHGGERRFVTPDGSVLEITRICLHAARVELEISPGVTRRFVAEVPEDLATLWTRLGGSPDALHVE